MDKKYRMDYDNEVSGKGEINIRFDHNLSYGNYLAVVELYEGDRYIRIDRLPFNVAQKN